MKTRLLLELALANAIVGGGLYLYLSLPNLMDITWGFSFALASVLLFNAISRDIRTRYILAAFLALFFLSWNFLTGVKNFWIYSLDMEYHGVVIRTTLVVLSFVFLLFFKSKHRDLAAISGAVLLSQIIGALWAAIYFKNPL